MATAVAASLLTLLLGPAAGTASADVRKTRAVFVQSNDPTGNDVLSYRAGADGSLTRVGSFPTGGLGGIAAGAASDPLASQGSLTHDPAHGLLFAVNAGSDSISMFSISGLRLRLIQEVDSRGRFPVSVAVHGRLVYVLNAGGDGNVSGFVIQKGGLRPLAGSTRSLGLGNTTPPDFTLSPGQIGFSPSGRQLIVTTKVNLTIEVFAIRSDGTPSADSVTTRDAGGPFGFLFDGAGHLLVTEVVTSAVTKYALGSDGTLTVVSGPVANGQVAACWIVTARGHLVVSNTGSNTLSTYSQTGSALTLIAGVAATTDAGPIDMAVSPSGSILYLQNGVDQTIQSFRVRADGSLTLLETTPGPPQTMGVPFEGIVAT